VHIRSLDTPSRSPFGRPASGNRGRAHGQLRRREALERIAASFSDYAAELHPELTGDPFDDAIALLGGEENICAG
jgi:hypothetical protein